MTEFDVERGWARRHNWMRSEGYVADTKLLDLYHRTSYESALALYEGASWMSREHDGAVYFSTHIDGQADGYGNAIVHVRVPVGLAELEDQFPSGELHYRVLASDLCPEHLLAIEQRGKLRDPR